MIASTAILAAMPSGIDALRAEPLEAALATVAILAGTFALGFGLRRATRDLHTLRAQLLLITLSGIVVGALVAWVLATLMVFDESQLAPAIGVLALTAAIAGVLVVIASTSLGGAAHRLAVTVGAIEAGDRSVRTGIDRNDELGRVAEALDQLTGRLAELEDEQTALEAERALMLTSVSHDLRSPLAALRVALEAMIDGVARDPERYLRSMRADVDALTALVDDFFLLASIEGGRLNLDQGLVDLSECCDEAIEALAPTAHARGIHLHLDTPGRVEVRGNANALGRVVRNLVDNAVRHAPDRSIVEVSVGRGGRPVVSVADTGDGFPPGFEERAFERWSRPDESRSRATGGSGLGLAIARGLVVAHGGRIWIDPPPGGRVAFELPVA